MLDFRASTLCLIGALTCGCGGDRPAPDAGPKPAAKAKQETPPNKPKPKTLVSGLECTKFEATAEFESGRLHVELDTDLPADVEVSLSVSRSYTEVGNESTYSIDYLDDDSKVADWSSGRDFHLSNEVALDRFAEKREKWAASGIDKEIEKFSESIEVWLLIRLSKPKASGTCKPTEHGNVEQTWEFKYPLDAKPPPVRALNPEGLVKGDRFPLTKQTPLMPSPDPTDPAAALAQVVMVPAKALVEVKAVRKVKGNTWYEVTVNRKRGWFNSTALIGQDLKREK